MAKYHIEQPAFCADVQGAPTAATSGTPVDLALTITPSGSGTITAVDYVAGDGTTVALTLNAGVWEGSHTYATAGECVTPSVLVTFAETTVQTEIGLEQIIVA